MDKDYIDYLCSLAKLEFKEKDYDKISKGLDTFRGYAEKLAEVNTENTEPLVNVNGTVNIMREDEVRPSMDRNIVLDNAPDKMYGCIKVNKIIE